MKPEVINELNDVMTPSSDRKKKRGRSGKSSRDDKGIILEDDDDDDRFAKTRNGIHSQKKTTPVVSRKRFQSDKVGPYSISRNARARDLKTSPQKTTIVDRLLGKSSSEKEWNDVKTPSQSHTNMRRESLSRPKKVQKTYAKQSHYFSARERSLPNQESSQGNNSVVSVGMICGFMSFIDTNDRLYFCQEKVGSSGNDLELTLKVFPDNIKLVAMRNPKSKMYDPRRNLDNVKMKWSHLQTVYKFPTRKDDYRVYRLIFKPNGNSHANNRNGVSRLFNVDYQGEFRQGTIEDFIFTVPVSDQRSIDLLDTHFEQKKVRYSFHFPKSNEKMEKGTRKILFQCREKASEKRHTPRFAFDRPRDNGADSTRKRSSSQAEYGAGSGIRSFADRYGNSSGNKQLQWSEPFPLRRSTRRSSNATNKMFNFPAEELGDILFTYPFQQAGSDGGADFKVNDEITVRKEDLTRTEETTYLNDILIDYFIKYLLLERFQKKAERKDDKRRRSSSSSSSSGANTLPTCVSLLHSVHAFSSLFLKRMLDKQKQARRSLPSKEEREDFVWDSISNWGRRTDIFDKSVLIVPVNDALHWSVMFVCNVDQIVPHVLQIAREMAEKRDNAQCILDAEESDPDACHQGRLEQSMPSKKNPNVQVEQLRQAARQATRMVANSRSCETETNYQESTTENQKRRDPISENSMIVDSSGDEAPGQAHHMAANSCRRERETYNQESITENQKRRDPVCQTSMAVDSSRDESPDFNKPSQHVPILSSTAKAETKSNDDSPVHSVSLANLPLNSQDIVNLLPVPNEGSGPGGKRTCGSLEGGGRINSSGASCASEASTNDDNDDLGSDIVDSSSDDNKKGPTRKKPRLFPTLAAQKAFKPELTMTYTTAVAKPNPRSSEQVNETPISPNSHSTSLGVDSNAKTDNQDCEDAPPLKARSTTPQSSASNSSNRDQSSAPEESAKAATASTVKGRNSKAKPLSMADLDVAKAKYNANLKPTIICLDSLRVHSSKMLATQIKLFLKRALIERLPDEAGISEDIVSRVVEDISYVEAPVPQQPNSYDCGVYVLQFVIKFLEKYVTVQELKMDALSKRDLRGLFGENLFNQTDVANRRIGLRDMIDKHKREYEKLKKSSNEAQADSPPSKEDDESDGDEVQILV